MPPQRQACIDRFLADSGWGNAQRLPLPGDASSRRYIRLRQGGHSAMLMDQPQNAESPVAPPGADVAARQALGYNALARLAGADCARFVACADYLRAQGFSAPAILAAAPADGLVLIEDFGEALFADTLAAGTAEAPLYFAAVEMLARLHAAPAPDTIAAKVPLHAYDEAALLAETDLLTEWFFPLALGRPASQAEVEDHRALWRTALAPLAATPRVFVHRDFHAQNLFWLPERAGAARIGLIDFQDALAGSPAYDLISLVEDARRHVAPALAEAATARYLAARRDLGIGLDADAFAAERAVIAAQRNAKIVGIFARLSARDGKTRYLQLLPRVWDYLNRDLDHPALSALQSWYGRCVPEKVRGEPRQGETV